MKIEIFTLLFSLNSFAGINFLTECKPEIQKQIASWKGLNQWSHRNDDLYISPTLNFGNWLWLKDEKDSITLTKANQKTQLRVNFSKANCQKKMLLVPIQKIDTSLNGDEYLERLIQHGKGIIYLWSPQMPLSQKGISEIKKVVIKHGFKLILILDPNAKNLKPEQFSENSLRLDSFELKMRNAYMHFPSVLGFENGNIKDFIKYGYETSEGFELDVKKIFNK